MPITRQRVKIDPHEAETPLVLDKSVAHNAVDVLNRIVSHQLVRRIPRITMSSELQGISSGLAAAAAIAVTTYLLRTVRPVARQEGGLTVVEYGKAMKVLVVIFWLFVVAASVAAAFARPDERAIAYSVVGGFFLLVLSLHLEFFHVSVHFDETGLHTTSPWRRGRFIPWSSITGVRFSPLAQWYVLSTSQLGHVRLHLYLSGLQTLLDELARRGFSIPPSPQRRQ